MLLCSTTSDSWKRLLATGQMLAVASLLGLAILLLQSTSTDPGWSWHDFALGLGYGLCGTLAGVSAVLNVVGLVQRRRALKP
jgi:ABC-type uncharacterized transport system permease subunit